MCPQSPSKSATPSFLSKASASFLRTSALNLRNAVSIRSLASGSRLIALTAEPLPVRKPVSPPIKRPPKPKKVYAATSPRVEGLRKGVTSGTASEYGKSRCQSILSHDTARKLTLPSVSESDMRGLLLCSKSSKHLQPRPTNSKGQQCTQAQAEQ